MKSQLDIQGIPCGEGHHKVQEEYEALSQGHGGTTRDFQNQREKSQHGYQMKNRIYLGNPCIGNLYHSHNTTSNSIMKDS